MILAGVLVCAFGMTACTDNPSSRPVQVQTPSDIPPGGNNTGALTSGPRESFENGTWSSPDEVVPGTYRSEGPEESVVPMCYVDTKGDDGESIVDQEISASGPVRIRVKEGQIVKASGCKTFERVS